MKFEKKKILFRIPLNAYFMNDIIDNGLNSLLIY